MQGDFSRLRFPQTRRDDGVMMQQGRVLLDSDWNAQSQMLRQRLATGSAAVIGPAGAPKGLAGFEITPLVSLTLGENQRLSVASSATLDLSSRQNTLEFSLELQGGDLGVASPGVFLLFITYSPEGDPSEVGGATLTFIYNDGQRWRMWRQSIKGFRELPVQLAVVLKASACFIYTDGNLLIDSGMPAIELESPPIFDASPDSALDIGVIPSNNSAGPSGSDESQLPQTNSSTVPGRRGIAFLGLRIWNRVLEAGSLDAVRGRRPANAPNQFLRPYLFPSGMICDLLFQAGQQSPVPDRSGCGNDGRLFGQPQTATASFWISPGIYFVDGVLCENPYYQSLLSQVDLPLERSPFARDGEYLVFLDVWPRFVSAIDDPTLLEIALGGGDTTGRIEALWQARVTLASSKDPIAGERSTGRMQARRVRPQASQVGNQLYRVEIAHPGCAGNHPPSSALLAKAIPIAEADPATATVILALGGKDSVAPPKLSQSVLLVYSEIDREENVDEPQFELARVRAVEGLLLTLDSLDPGLKGLIPIATFVWSRDNASVAYSVLAATPSRQPDGERLATLRLSPLGRPELQLAAEEWVELTNDVLELHHQRGMFLQIRSVDPTLFEVVVDDWPANSPIDLSPRVHPRVVQWSTSTPSSTPPRPVFGDQWLELENGIEVRFEASDNEGDLSWYAGSAYWTMPVRDVAVGSLEWPGGPLEAAALLPEGIPHAWAPLAVVDQSGQSLEVTKDERRLFTPLAQPFPAASGGIGQSSKESETGPATGLVLSSPKQVPAGRRPTGKSLTLRGVGAWEIGAKPPAEVDGPGQAALISPWELAFVGGQEARLWRFHRGTGMWDMGTELPTRRVDFASVVVGYDLFLLGGSEFAGGPPLATIDVLDLAADSLRCEDLPVPVAGAAAAVLDGKVWVVGGRDRKGLPLAVVQVFDPKTKQWTFAQDLSTARYGLALTAHHGLLYALGGQGVAGGLDTVEVYAPASDGWRRAAALPMALDDPEAVSVPEGIVLVGGATSRAVLYHPSENRWESLPPLPAPTRAPGVATDGDHIWVVGGGSPKGASFYVLPLTSTYEAFQ